MSKRWLVLLGIVATSLLAPEAGSPEADSSRVVGTAESQGLPEVEVARDDLDQVVLEVANTLGPGGGTGFRVPLVHKLGRLRTFALDGVPVSEQPAAAA